MDRIDFARRALAHGKKRMLWRKGALEFGGAMFIFLNICELIRHPLQWREPGFVPWIFVSILECAAFGYVWGWIMWKYYERMASSK